MRAADPPGGESPSPIDASPVAGEGRLRIQERFVSLQGEGILVGTPSRFVRVSGCNLRCSWCDTPRSSWAPEGSFVSVDTLVAECAAGPRHVVLTGGEPLLFAAIAPLSRRLRAAGHHVTIETAGTVRVAGVQADLMSLSPKLDHASPRTRDPRLALRHDAARYAPEVLRALMADHAWQLKFVVRSDEAALARDLEEIEAMLEALDVRPADRDRVLLMPEGIDPEVIARAYTRLTPVCVERGFRLGQRLHIALFGHTPGT